MKNIEKLRETRDQIIKQLDLVEQEINPLEYQEKLLKMKEMIGNTYKYNNTNRYYDKKPVFLYMKILDVVATDHDGDFLIIKIQDDGNEIIIRTEKYAFFMIYMRYETISLEEFNKEYTRILEKITNQYSEIMS